MRVTMGTCVDIECQRGGAGVDMTNNREHETVRLHPQCNEMGIPFTVGAFLNILFILCGFSIAKWWAVFDGAVRLSYCLAVKLASM